MSWEAITAIATSLTVLAVLGGASLLYLLTKPKISIVSIEPIHWFYTFEGGDEINGAKITIQIRLINTGSEKTHIGGKFITSDRKLFNLDCPVELEGHGAEREDIICLDFLSKEQLPEKGKIISGILQLEPWGNRRLLLIGKKYLSVKLDIPYDKTLRGASVKWKETKT